MPKYLPSSYLAPFISQSTLRYFPETIAMVAFAIPAQIPARTVKTKVMVLLSVINPM
jgi:hypothetical protein